MIFELIAILFFIKISLYDIKYHLIKNIDLIILLLILLPIYRSNWRISLLSLGIYLILNIIGGGKIGLGDIKLSFICAMPLGSYFDLFNALSITWIIGGIYVLFRRSKSVAFAPFMIIGTYISKIL